jgi:hypothetical protein
MAVQKPRQPVAEARKPRCHQAAAMIPRSKDYLPRNL